MEEIAQNIEAIEKENKNIWKVILMRKMKLHPTK